MKFIGTSPRFDEMGNPLHLPTASARKTVDQVTADWIAGNAKRLAETETALAAQAKVDALAAAAKAKADAWAEERRHAEAADASARASYTPMLAASLADAAPVSRLAALTSWTDRELAAGRLNEIRRNLGKTLASDDRTLMLAEAHKLEHLLQNQNPRSVK